MTDPFGTCPVCGEGVGAYEPLAMVLADGRIVEGGLLELREHSGQGRLHHRACLESSPPRLDPQPG